LPTALPLPTSLTLPIAVSFPERIGISLPDPTALPFRMSPFRTSTWGAITVLVSVLLCEAYDDHFE
jgi:hypothetical protein